MKRFCNGLIPQPAGCLLPYAAKGTTGNINVASEY
jgi:hypothetical protein